MVDEANNSNVNCDDLADVRRRLPAANVWEQEFEIATSPDMLPEQQAAFDSVTGMAAGMVLLTGGPGSGKTHVTRRIAHHFAREGKRVLLLATTGAAAVNLSRSASTVHDNFVIPVNGFISSLALHNPMRAVLKQGSVFIIDEMSMLTSAMLLNILNRLMVIHGCNSIDGLLQKVLIVLVSPCLNPKP
jgi:exodeoxyribonuclease V alpha subunit